MLEGPGCSSKDVICSLGVGRSSVLELHPRHRREGRIPGGYSLLLLWLYSVLSGRVEVSMRTKICT